MSVAEVIEEREEADGDVRETMRGLGAAAKAAAATLATAAPGAKARALKAGAAGLRRDGEAIIAANALDMAAGERKGLRASFLDRLLLTPERVEAMAAALEEIADMADPVGAVIAEWERPNGLKIARVRTPLGVIGVIYESRPNVTADAAALCLKSGNAVILRGGSESFHSARAIHQRLAEGLAAAGLPEAAIQLTPTRDRAAVGVMLAEMADQIDVIVPRGGRNLVARVQAEARVPVFAHLEGICHVYVDAAANPAMAAEIAVNSKMRRTGICGAAETLLLDRAGRRETHRGVLSALINAGCEVRGDGDVRAIEPRALPAAAHDWDAEYLAPIIAARMVDGVTGAVAHIRAHGSGHTEAIVSEDAGAVGAFFRELDSAILLHNASTQYADGGEFGMGAEIGIATGKMHARGPVGVEQLTSFKYLVRGAGQTRP